VTEDTKLDWGSFVGPPLSKWWPAKHDGRDLFIIRNGTIGFPKQDTRVWPWDVISAVGYLNVKPTQFRVDVDGLTSKDQVSCCCVIVYEVRLKTDDTSYQDAVSRSTSLYGTFSLLTKLHAISVFEQFNYSDLRMANKEVQNKFKEAVEEAVSQSTPYVLKSCVVSTASITEGLDDQIILANSAKLSTEKELEIARQKATVIAVVKEGQRGDAIAELNHKNSLDKKTNAAARKQRQAEERDKLAFEGDRQSQQLSLEKQKQDMELDRKKKEIELEASTLELIQKYPMIYMERFRPDLYAKILMMDSQGASDKVAAMTAIAVASAFTEGGGEQLKKIAVGMRLQIAEVAVKPDTYTQTESKNETKDDAVGS